MKSIARHHFPRIVFDHDQKKLFNPILKKRYKNRPEERVRLKWIEYLLQQTDWPKSRIGFEAPVRIRQEKNALRADLVLYNTAMEPVVLVECKAETVPLTPAVAEQASRYNADIDAEYLCLTNGISDYWFDVRGKTPEPVDSPIQETKSFTDIDKTGDWWGQRGFMPQNLSHPLVELMPPFLEAFWSESLNWQDRFLTIPDGPVPIDLDSYYRIIRIDNSQKLAVTFLGTPSQEGYMIALLNKNGQNSGFLAVQLNPYIDSADDRAGTVLYKEGVKHECRPRKYLSDPRHLFNPGNIEKLPLFIMRFFD